MTDYQSFDLLIIPHENGYLTQVLGSPVGQADGVLALDFTDQELAALKGEIPLDAVNLTPQTAGQRLFKALFDGPVETSYRRSLDAVRTADGKEDGLRINLRLDRAPELALLPWESLFDAKERAYLSLSRRTPLVRYMQLAQPVADLPVAPPLHILVLISNPGDLGATLNVQDERRRIEAALQPLVDKGHVVLDCLEGATLDQLQDRLRRGDVHVLHYIGHAVYDPRQQQGFVLLEDDEGSARPVSAEQMRVVLGDETDLRLVFLNACEGAQSLGEDNFTGIAQSLVLADVPAVIGMMQPVGDATAARLAGVFYKSVADGYPVDAALAEARKSIFLQGDALSWGLPVLFSRSQDNRLIEESTATTDSPELVHSMSIRRHLIPLGATLALLVALSLVAFFLPADSIFGRVQAAFDMRSCFDHQSEKLCVLVSRLAGNGEASDVATRLLESGLEDAVESSDFTVVRTRPVEDRDEAVALARGYASPLIVWGEVFRLNDLNAKVHLDLIDRLGIAQGADLEPFRLQQFPVDDASLTIDIPCEGEADCLGTENGRLVQSAPTVARLAMGLTYYSLRQVEAARQLLSPIAACAFSIEDPDCTDPDLLTYLDDRARSLVLYYMGRIYGMQQDYARALDYLTKASELAPDNPTLLIAAGWILQNWGGAVEPTEATIALTQARQQLGFDCRANDSGEHAGERLYTLGVIYELQGDWLDAETCYALAAEVIAEQNDDPYPVLINLARAQRQIGQDEDAQATLKRAQASAPDLPWVSLELARLNVDDQDQARAHLDEALALAPDSYHVHMAEADLCTAWDESACVESALQAASSLRPDYGWLLARMADFYRLQQDWPRTEFYLTRILELGDGNPKTYEDLGFVYLNQEKLPEAADAYLQSLQLAFSDESARHLFCNVSSLLANQGRDDVELLQKCVEWTEEENHRAWAEQRLQELDAASSSE